MWILQVNVSMVFCSQMRNDHIFVTMQSMHTECLNINPFNVYSEKPMQWYSCKGHSMTTWPSTHLSSMYAEVCHEKLLLIHNWTDVLTIHLKGPSPHIKHCEPGLWSAYQCQTVWFDIIALPNSEVMKGWENTTELTLFLLFRIKSIVTLINISWL